MRRIARLAALLVTALPAVSFAAAGELATDANIVTGIDISDSVNAEILNLEIAGLAAAIRSPEVLRAIRNGRLGRIGFAVFAWHNGNFPEVAGWAVIAGEADAQAVARRVEQRLTVDATAEARAVQTEFYRRLLPAGTPYVIGQYSFYYGRLTDLSGALDHGTDSLAKAPFQAQRGIINIIGEGADNVVRKHATAPWLKA